MMINKKFGRLTVIENLGYYAKQGTKTKRTYVKCLCDCGNEIEVRLDSLKGNTKSCGCLNYESKWSTHGQSGTKLYRVWASMKNRCDNELDSAYKWYGGKCVTYDKSWGKFEGFLNWAESSGYEEGLTIERVDVDGNYQPDNCKWITQSEQLLNTTRTLNIEYNGQTKTLKEWSDVLGIKYDTLYARINYPNWSVERAFTEPVNRKV